MFYRLNFEVLICWEQTLHSWSHYYYFPAEDDRAAIQKAKQYLADRNEFRSTILNQEKTRAIALERIEIQLEPVLRAMLLKLEL